MPNYVFKPNSQSVAILPNLNLIFKISYDVATGKVIGEIITLNDCEITKNFDSLTVKSNIFDLVITGKGTGSFKKNEAIASGSISVAIDKLLNKELTIQNSLYEMVNDNLIHITGFTTILSLVTIKSLLYKNGKKIVNIYHNGKLLDLLYKCGKVIYSPLTPLKIVSFAEGTDKEIVAMINAHYKGQINIADYWHVGDTRVMHLNAMEAGEGASEAHAAQDMTMVIIGLNHDNLKTPINGKTKAAITLQCRETLGNKGSEEGGYLWGSDVTTSIDSNYATNPRRVWLNGTFINSLPSLIQSVIKTVIKKNINDHNYNTVAGPNTEDKAFLTSTSEMFGNSAGGSSYRGNESLEGEQYPYYNSNERRTKYGNNNGIPSEYAGICEYWLRSPSAFRPSWWIYVMEGEVNDDENRQRGIAPAFCL